MEVTALYPNHAFNHSMASVQHGIHDLMRPQVAYRTSEIDRQLRAIDNGISHVKLDAEFVDGSTGWRQHFPERDIQAHRAGITNTLGKGSHVLSTYRSHMTPGTVKNLQDNEVREQHQWAVQNLQGLRHEMHPYTAHSHQRVQQFCDWVGVTDRFNGYRHNLSRPAERLAYEPYWRRGSNAPTSKQVKFAHEVTPQRSIGQRFNVRAVSAPPQTNYATKEHHSGSRKAYPAQTPQEKAGIITKYPGVSEYKEIYKRPATAVSYDYRVNPTPNFGVIGRPLLPVEVDKKITEYNFRYEWPSGDRIEPLPWQRNKSN